jgi:hypothetical protein
MDDINDANNSFKARKPDVSRRKFITTAMTSAGATAVTALGADKVTAINSSEAGEIKLPDEFALAAKVTPVKAEFPMTGAQVFARVCKEEGLAALFCCPATTMSSMPSLWKVFPPTLAGTKAQCVTPLMPSFV